MLSLLCLSLTIATETADESMFVDLNGKQSRDYIIKWTSFPHAVGQFLLAICFVSDSESNDCVRAVYVHPFVIGFMRDSVELRTLVNGRLVQALPLQSSWYRVILFVLYCIVLYCFILFCFALI